MFRWLRLFPILVLFFSLGSPAAPRSAAADLPAAASVAAPRLVVFEGFYSPT